MKKDTDILQNLISDTPSNWKAKAEYRKTNKAWLDKSADIALLILEHLRQNKISQKQLAEMIDVSPQFVNKLVKGSENLTLKTISNIENALGISLIKVQNVAESIALDKIPIPPSIEYSQEVSNEFDFANRFEELNENCLIYRLGA